MKDDPKRKGKLDAAEERQSRYLSQQVEAGDKRNEAPVEPQVEESSMRRSGEAEPKEPEEGDDDGIPEADAEDVEPRAKRSRLGSASEAVAEENQSDGEEPPDPKRPRTVSAVMSDTKRDKKKSWVELVEEEEQGVHNGREDLVCGPCGVRFGSRKQLYQHVRKLGVEAESVRKVAFNIDRVDKEAVAAKGPKKGSATFFRPYQDCHLQLKVRKRSQLRGLKRVALPLFGPSQDCHLQLKVVMGKGALGLIFARPSFRSE